MNPTKPADRRPKKTLMKEQANPLQSASTEALVAFARSLHEFAQREQRRQPLTVGKHGRKVWLPRKTKRQV